MPAAGYELERLAVRGLDRRNPLRAARALAQCRARGPPRARAAAASARHRRRDGRRRLRRRPGRRWPRRRARIPLVLTEADSHLGLDQPRARAARAPRLPGLPDRRPQRPPLPASPGARSPAPAADRDGRASRVRRSSRGRAAACSSSAARSARARSTRPRSPGLDGASFRVLHVDRRARLADAAARRAHGPLLRPARVPRPRRLRRRRSRPATSSSRAPAARSSRSPPTGARRSSCPIPHATADHQTTNARLDGAGGRGGRARRRASSTARGSRARSAGWSATARGWRRWRARRWGSRAPRRRARRSRRDACWRRRGGERARRPGRGTAGCTSSASRGAGHERLRARRARARGERQRLRPGAARRSPRRCAADGVLEAVDRARRRQRPRRRGRRGRLLERRSPPANPERARGARARACACCSRAQLLGELSALRRTIAVAGAHGKTTTASMIVARAARRRARPGLPDRRDPARHRAQRRMGQRRVARRRGRRVRPLDARARRSRSRSLTNVELDHHDVFGSLAELEARLPRVPRRRAPQAVIWDRPELRALRAGPLRSPTTPPMRRADGGRRRAFAARASTVELARPGRPQRPQRRRGARRSRALAGVDRRSRRPRRSRGFRGAARRFELLGASAAGAAVYDDYAHHPTEIAATLAAARTLAPAAADRGLPAPPLLAHAGAGPRVRRRARGRRRGRRARRLPGARAGGGLPGRQRAAGRRGGGRRRGGPAGLLAARPRRRGARAAPAARR